MHLEPERHELIDSHPFIDHVRRETGLGRDLGLYRHRIHESWVVFKWEPRRDACTGEISEIWTIPKGEPFTRKDVMMVKANTHVNRKPPWVRAKEHIARTKAKARDETREHDDDIREHKRVEKFCRRNMTRKNNADKPALTAIG